MQLWPYIVMAYIVMAYIVLAYIVMAYVVMTYISMAYVVMTYIFMAYIVMTYIVMAHRSYCEATEAIVAAGSQVGMSASPSTSRLYSYGNI